MKLLQITLLATLLLVCEAKSNRTFRFLTSNLWTNMKAVENGLAKTVKHIQILDPDVISVQECSTECAESIVKALGNNWTSLKSSSDSGTTILTRHKILTEDEALFDRNHGAMIQLENGRKIYVVGIHLSPSSYFGSKWEVDAVYTVQDYLNSEKTRLGELEEVFNNETVSKVLSTSDIPVFFAGVFNAPSHLDWTEDTRKLNKDLVVPWPLSILMEQKGFKDAYRVVHPDELNEPGLTWSNTKKWNHYSSKTAEPQERIDYIYYKGDVVPMKVETYEGTQKSAVFVYANDNKAGHWFNDFPSDHAFVYADFVFI